MKRSKTKKSKKFLIIALTCAIVVAAFLFVLIRHNHAANRSVATRTPGQQGQINYGPPTKDEIQAAEQNKDRLVREKAESESSSQQTGIKPVSPVITDAGVYDNNLEVSSFVPGIFEDDGTCTVTISKGAEKVVREGKGFKNVSYTQCPNVSIPKTTFSKGTWEVTVSYSSNTAQGLTPEARKIEVR